jgi:hypothetical protein
MASGLTPTYLLPYPLSTDPVNVHGDVESLAERLESLLVAFVTVAQSNTFIQPNTFDVNSTSTAVRITQTGTGNALLVEDAANPDTTPFIIDNAGNVGIGKLSPTTKLDVLGATALSVSSASSVPLTIQGATSQSANLSEWKTSAGTVVASISPTGVISSATWQGSVIGPTYGGTGLNSYNAGDIIYASASNTLAKLSAGTGAAGKFLTVDTLGIPGWGTIDQSAVTGLSSALSAKQDVVSGVTSTEISYLGGAFPVTSSIQTQINGKANTTHTHAISDVTNLQTSLDAKANLAGPTFTGNVVLPGTTTIGNVSSTELGFIDGVTSAIQTQLDSKAPINNPTFTGTVTGTVAQLSSAANGATSIGYMGIPASAASGSGAYTIVAADAGDHIYTTASRTVTIPANSSVPFQIGTTIVFISGAGATTTISINSDTMLLVGAGTSGTRTLAAHGMATAVKVASTTWYISGNGLT